MTDDPLLLFVAAIQITLAIAALVSPIYLWRVSRRSKLDGLWLLRALAITFTVVAIPAAFLSLLGANRVLFGTAITLTYPTWVLSAATCSQIAVCAAPVFLLAQFIRHSRDE